MARGPGPEMADLPPEPVLALRFGPAVRALRRRAGLSMHELARRAGVDPAYVLRMERPGPAARPTLPRRPVVVAVGLALGLGRLELDDLLARAGHVPETLVDLGGWDRALADAAAVLASADVSPEAKAEFREVIQILAGRWLRGA